MTIQTEEEREREIMNIEDLKNHQWEDLISNMIPKGATITWIQWPELETSDQTIDMSFPYSPNESAFKSHTSPSEPLFFESDT